MDHHIIYRRVSSGMVLRKTGKILALIGCVICISCLGIMYNNLTSITEERNQIIEKKNEIKRETLEKDSRIKSLESDVRILQSSLASCNSKRDLAVDRNRVLLEESEQYRDQLKDHKSELESIKLRKSDDVQSLKDKIFDLETANRGLEESITSCKSSSWELQQKLTSSKEHASSLDQSLSFCVQNAKKQKDPPNLAVVEEQVADRDGLGNKVNAVAAVPQSADNKDGSAVEDHVADIPEPNPNNNPVQVDNEKGIPEALVPIPQQAGDAPRVDGEHAAIAPIPGEVKKDTLDDNKQPDIVPLQPRPDQALVDSLNVIQEQEQLQQLQERLEQQQQQPLQEPVGDSPADLQPKQPDENNPDQPAEIQVAPPAPPANN